MKLLKRRLLDNAPLQVGACFVLSKGCLERIVLDASAFQWDVVSYDDEQQVKEFSDRFLIPWCHGWINGRHDVLPLNLNENELLIQKGLAGVERGKTVSYSDFADRLSISPRAAGRMLGQNRFPLVIPCHRVICKDGQIGGYLGGVELKKRLLLFESQR